MRHFAAAALLCAGIIGVAAAQTTQGTNPPSTPGTGSGAMRSAEVNTVVARFVTVKPADVLSSRLVGTNLYNKQNESIGEIQDLVIENGKTVTGVVVSVGGFLGIGERYVALDPATIVLHRDNNTLKAIADTSKENLRDAPTFDYSKRR